MKLSLAAIYSKSLIISIQYSLIFIICSFLFYGCFGSQIEYPAPSENAKEGTFVSEEGIYELYGKEYVADYGTITVPENRHKIDSRLIYLPVIRIHARSKNISEPVFQLSGGPGQTNMQCWVANDSLLYNHDFVMVGYRGVDGSSVLNCPEVVEAIEDAEDDFLSEQSLKEYGKAWNASIERFKSEGVDLNGYTIPETIEDMEAARKILNYKRINLASGSYGTRVAYLYGLMHPESINRSVMVAVNPPGGFLWDPKKTDEQIRHYSYLWSKDSVRAQQSPDLAATMDRVLKKMPEKWLLFSIDPGKVKMMTFVLLYQRQTAALAFDSFVAAEQGDYSGLALMSMAFDYIVPDLFVWGDMAAKSITADKNYWKEFDSEHSYVILNPPFNDFFWKTFKYVDFKLEMIPDSLQVPQESNVETLMISGNVDFANPAQCATGLLSYLKNGKQVIISEAGHVGDLLYLQENATRQLITNYYNTGIVDTSEIKYIPVNFDAGWGFTGIAKAAVGTVTVLAVLLAAGIVLLIN